jgi:hypothetical protein
LQAEFSAMEQLPFLGGVNYWVGPGNEWSGGHTHIFGGQRGSWTLRPAANDLAAFYVLERAGISPSPAPSPTASPEPSPTSPATRASASGQATHQSPRARPTSGGNAGAHLSGAVIAPKGGGGSGSGSGAAPDGAGAGRGKSGATPVMAGLVTGFVVVLLAASVGLRLATRRKRSWRFVHRV